MIFHLSKPRADHETEIKALNYSQCNFTMLCYAVQAAIIKTFTHKADLNLELEEPKSLHRRMCINTFARHKSLRFIEMLYIKIWVLSSLLFSLIDAQV